MSPFNMDETSLKPFKKMTEKQEEIGIVGYPLVAEICECGHDKEIHWNYVGVCCIEEAHPDIKCSCKKFTPKNQEKEK